jgi:hypothetical protein
MQMDKLQNFPYLNIMQELINLVRHEKWGRIRVRKRLQEQHGINASERQAKVLVKLINDDTITEGLTYDEIQLGAIMLKSIHEGDEGARAPEPHQEPATEPQQPHTDKQPQENHEDANDLTNKLRETYGIHDASWEPVTIWGDARNPLVKWVRRKPIITMQEAQERIQLSPETHSIVLHEQQSFGRKVGMLSMRDAHFGLMTEHPQPYDKYDLSEASNVMQEAGSYLLSVAHKNEVSDLIIPVGSDLLHVDGSSLTTTKGTRQDTNAFWWEAFNAAINSINAIVRTATKHFSTITIIIEPGNHDSSLTRALGVTMRAAWPDEGIVRILDHPETLKRVSFGNTHLFTHHGNSIKPNQLQALIHARHPDVISRDSYVEVLCGHYHHRSSKVLNQTNEYLEFNGITLRITPALCPASNWSESQGYISSPGAQLTIYNDAGFLSLHEWRPQITRGKSPNRT